MSGASERVASRSDVEISIIILAFNSAHFIGECIRSAILTISLLNCNSEIVVLDNASEDETFAVAQRAAGGDPRILLFRTEVGLGYTGGNNYAASFASGDLLFFLNDDCVLAPDTTRALVDLFSMDKRIDVAQVPLLSDDGTSINSLGTYMDLLGFIDQPNMDMPVQNILIPERPSDIFAVSGAAFAIRAVVFRDLLGFDQRMGFLFEETDLCWRALLAGGRVVLSPKGRAYHRKMARYLVGANQGFGNAEYLFTRNRIRALLKNLSVPSALLIVPTHILLLCVVAIASGRGRRIASFRNLLGAILWNIMAFRDNLKERRTVQGRRCVSDFVLWRRGLLRTPNVLSLLTQYAQRNKKR